MKNVLSFDIEEYFQVENFKEAISRSEWDRLEFRLRIGMERILNVLTKSHLRSTFFILGWIAERHPQLIKDIASLGHEIASHGYDHQLIYEQTKERFRQDLRHSIDILESLTGHKVVSYRAPSFSITHESLWALDILAEEGIQYDSSIFPIYHDRYGMPDAERKPHKVLLTGNRELHEFPMSTFSVFGKRLPFSGGGYLRLLPSAWIIHMGNSVNREGIPFNTYLHPWEFDPAQPRVAASRISQFRHYLNLSKTEDKLKRLIDQFSFTTLKDYFSNDFKP